MSGILNGLEINLYNDPGYIDNDNSMTDPAMLLIDNGKFFTESDLMFVPIQTVYKCANWTVTPKSCKTHNSPNTYCRSPGLAIIHLTAAHSTYYSYRFCTRHLYHGVHYDSSG